MKTVLEAQMSIQTTVPAGVKIKVTPHLTATEGRPNPTNGTPDLPLLSALHHTVRMEAQMAGATEHESR